MVLRGESRRWAQLADLVTLPLPNEGPTLCHALILIMRNGKLNKHHKVEYMGALRNKDLLLCPLSSLGFYFFWRWGYVVKGSSSKQPSQPWRRLPSFYQPSDYYDLHVFPGDTRHPDRQWAYEGQRDWTEKLFAGAGIQSTTITHAPRKQAARHAEIEGVKEAQIRRAGLWNKDAMSRVYLTSLPRKFMRTMAGFREERGSFFLPRASVEPPPPELTQLIWPEVDEWLAKMEAYKPGSKRNQVQRRDLAGSGFLRLLRVLRTVILQDSVGLRQLFPEHPIWKADVFASEAYQTFAAKVAAASESAEDPEDLQIKKALPILYDRMSMLREDVKQSIKTVSSKMDALASEVNELKGTVLDFADGKKSFTVFANSEDPRTSSQPQGTAAIPPGAAAILQTPDVPLLSGSGISPARFDPTLEPIRYKFSRTVTTVVDLWKEWSIGLESGPSIQQLDSTWGARWKDQNESQFYSRRLPIIRAIQQRCASGKASSLQEAAAQLETLRLQGGGSMSLNKFAKVLKEAAGG